METQTRTESEQQRITASLPFVQALARRLAASMPHSIEIGDLVQDGMIGLIDAANRYDEARGIKFETFAERRVRGSMIDALRRDAWPRGVRRARRELEAAREHLRTELGAEPSLADLANHLGADETRLSRTIVRIRTIESTSPLATNEHVDESTLPPALVPSEPPAPDKECERGEIQRRVRSAISNLPARERRVITMYYFGEVTMKTIGGAIGVNESRVSQLHARAIQRLRAHLGPDIAPARLTSALARLTSSRTPLSSSTPSSARPSPGAPKAKARSSTKNKGRSTKGRVPRVTNLRPVRVLAAGHAA
jgi:RNA polymerase sigma factor for flagellar operon FliA